MSSEEKNCEQQSALFSCSLHSHSCILMPLSEKPGSTKLSSSEPGCCIKPSSIKVITESLQICKKCGTKLTVPKSVSLSVELCECEYKTLPSPTVSEEDTHEHKSSDTFACIHNSQGVQPTDEVSESCPASCTGACSSLSSVTAQTSVYIDPVLRDHIPKSIEELKASITGLTGLEKSPVGNQRGCEFIEFRCEIRTSGLVCEPEDSEPSCSNRPLKQGLSLTMEPNDHRFCTNPDDCKHTRAPPPCPPEEPPCPPEVPPCPPDEPPCPPEEPPCSPCDSVESECCRRRCSWRRPTQLNKKINNAIILEKKALPTHNFCS